MAIDLDAYFARIGYTGERTPTLETLRAVQRLHAATIPFENLNSLLGWPVKLDPESLQQKLVRSRRGGYCFEQNLLLRLVLEQLGFRVSGLSGRVVLTAPPGTIPARTHMLLRVEIAGETYLADVGFGQTPTAPLRLVPEVPQDTPHERLRLRADGSEFVLEAEIRGEWRPFYRFDLTEQHAIDYEVGNWYVSTCPASHITTTLMAGRAADGKRYALRDNEFATHSTSGTERRVLSAGELREVLSDVFGIELPDTPEVRAMFPRIAAKAPPP
jgi:N-hydroxyarylamine O-acetyltransferase